MEVPEQLSDYLIVSDLRDSLYELRTRQINWFFKLVVCLVGGTFLCIIATDDRGNPWIEWPLVVIGILYVVVTVTFRREVTIDLAAGTVASRAYAVFRQPIYRRSWHIRPDMRIVLLKNLDNEADYYTLAIADGRKLFQLDGRQPITPEDRETLEQLAVFLAQLLGIEFAGYESPWKRFYW
ncbi:hypothetical protein [Aeoliella mucimassa]|uniref:Uncharacterized protein n=1 Tax=Aeoliella mucimassa TaxID=2527972 RepID=A0A518AVX6_9BACT|nr:hypothetical protein [Aeoliella mucimassa]QDU58873.1 hypothetical protein Pan181_51130 [Aeoliella mucimassa]